MVLVVIDSESNDERFQYLYDLLIPGRFILSQLPDSPVPGTARELPWQEYSRQCRLVNTLHRLPGVVHGSRYATSYGIVAEVDGDPDQSVALDVLEISHFIEPAAIRRDTATDSDLSDTADAEAAELKPEVLRVMNTFDQSNDEVWAEPMVVGAPYYATCTDLTLEDTGELYLLEDGVVLVEKDSQCV